MIYPLEQLRSKDFAVTGFFYNPNIHPLGEYNNRKEALDKLGLNYDCEVMYPEYQPQEFFRAVNLKETTPERCALCWKLRLQRTAEAAKEKGFTHFSTTLLVSPYQDQELLKRIGNDVAEDTGAEFYYEDFRPGFREAHNKAHALGIYCQRYCGCLYSERERCDKALKK
jgi:predicted adenine nucleotide alpha hydrolase (AANH) superfamily ATPase